MKLVIIKNRIRATNNRIVIIKNKHPVDKIAEPQSPKYLPNNPAKQEPIKNKNTLNKYILLY